MLYGQDRVFFAGGNTKVYEKLQNLYNPDDYFVVYVDVSPNNTTTVVLFRRLASLPLCKKRNVLLLPIVCIEYYVLRMLSDNSILRIRPEWNDLYDALFVKEDFLSALKIKNLSVEKLYKLLVTGQFQKCAYNSSQFGVYYKEDCPCSLRCNINPSIRLADKSFSLWRLLPVMDDDTLFSVLPDDCEYRELSKQDIIKERTEFYSWLFSKFGIKYRSLFLEG